MKTMLHKIGGEDALRELVERFYDLIESDPRGENIKRLHLRGHGIAHTRKQQFDFLCGFFGGRRYYEEHHHHMNIKHIHAHLLITKADAENWLSCMKDTLEGCGHQGDVAAQIMASFTRVAFVLINSKD